MALLICGKSVCSLCEQIIKQDEPTCSFPPFIANEFDPCFVFSDGVFHESCIFKHKHGSDALRRVDEWSSRVGPGKRKCDVCKTEVSDPDDYLVIVRLSDREGDALWEFNYTHLHKSCIPNWDRGARFVSLAKAVLASGYWKGQYLFRLIEEIERKPFQR